MSVPMENSNMNGGAPVARPQTRRSELGLVGSSSLLFVCHALPLPAIDIHIHPQLPDPGWRVHFRKHHFPLHPKRYRQRL